MKTSTLLYVSVTGIILVIAFFVFPKILASTRTKKIDESEVIKQLINTVVLHGQDIQMSIDRTATVTDSLGDTIAITKLLNKRKTIFRIQEVNCFNCIQRYLPFFNRLAKKLGKENVLILGSYKSPRLLFLQLKNYDVATKLIYNIDPKFLSNQYIEKQNVPYVFQIDSSLTARNIFIPNKEVPQLSEFYESILSVN